MKRVLITGANSYVGDSVATYIAEHYPEISVDIVDMKSPAWRDKDFSGYDSVFHVAGIAHDTGNKKDAELYYSVNTDLTLETAKKAKESGVGQFIFMSSMLVYNGCKERNIDRNTVPRVKGC